MAHEKQKASDAIVQYIEDYAQDLKAQDHDAIIHALEEDYQVYQKDLNKDVDRRIKREGDALKRIYNQEKAHIKHTIQQDLLKYRHSLMEQYRNQLEAEILLYKQSDAYVDAINKRIASFAQDHQSFVIVLDVSDQGRFKYESIEYKTLALGGVQFETESKIYDYSLQTRLDDVLQTLTEDVRLQMKEVTYE